MSAILERSAAVLAAAQAPSDVRLSTAQLHVEAVGAAPATVVISNRGAAPAVFSICAVPAKVRAETDTFWLFFRVCSRF